MKWISIAAGVAFVVGAFMVREGQVASSMKAENREALILYGLGICMLSCLWLVIHGLVALFRWGLKNNPPDADAKG